LNFTVLQGNNPANQALVLTNTGGGVLNWAAVADAGGPAWLTVTPTNGTGIATTAVSVASASLPAGFYSKTITVTAVGATNSPQIVPVILTVNSPSPDLGVSPAALSFSMLQGVDPQAQAFEITNRGGGLLTWTALPDASPPTWLTVNPTNGTGNATAVVAVAGASLAPGIYNKTITVTAPGAANSPRILAVSLIVTVPPRLTVNPTTLAFSSVTGVNPTPAGAARCRAAASSCRRRSAPAQLAGRARCRRGRAPRAAHRAGGAAACGSSRCRGHS